MDVTGEALAGALEYVEAGYAVGPVEIRLDERGKKRARFLTNWQADPAGVTRDPEQVKAWAAQYPGCGFHAPTKPNGLVVVEGDVKRDASGAFVADGRRSWRGAGGPPSPMTVTTQSGGEHWYFRAPEGEPIRNSAKAIPGVPDVDVRADGGTVFISGTSVRGGGSYVANRVLPVAELPRLGEKWERRLREAGPNGDRSRRPASRKTPTGRRLVSYSSIHDRAWIVAKVDDELRELVRGGQSDFRQRLFACAAIVYRAVGSGALDPDEADERLHDAISRVWSSEPNRDDLQWLAEAEEAAHADPWRLAVEQAEQAEQAERDEPAELADATAGDEPEKAPVDHFENLVAHELRNLRAREEAKRRLRADRRPVDRPSPVSLSAFLEKPDEPAQYRVEGLLPKGGHVMFAAQAKAGKSTARDNLVRALVDGEPFLGEHEIEPFAGTVVVIDAELDERMLRRWMREQRIVNTDRVQVVSLRGRTSTFDLTDPDVLREWAEVLREVEPAVVILDCLRPILDAIGLDEDKDAGRFLVAFDELLELAGASEAVLVHHMGHNAERTRGSSRLRDWPDVTWTLTRKDADDQASPRYFAAYGRDVDQPERELGYDRDSRRLTVVGGSRRDAANDGAAAAVLAVLGEEEGLSGRAIEEKLEKTLTTRAIRTGIKTAVKSGRVVVRSGPKRANLHYLSDEYRRDLQAAGILALGSSASVRRSASEVRHRTESECVSASIDDALTRTDEVSVCASQDGAA